MIKRPWLDPARDAVHLNWEPLADIEWQSFDWGDPARYLIELASFTRSGRASIMLGLLQDFQLRKNPEEPHEHYRWTRSELASILCTRSAWTVVILPPVVIHSNTAMAAGPFGLLGDARVQVVEDEAEMAAILALGEMPNVTINGAFTSEDFFQGKQELHIAASEVFGSRYSEVRVRPAVMFRLCTSQCKHVTDCSPTKAPQTALPSSQSTPALPRSILNQGSPTTSESSESIGTDSFENWEAEMVCQYQKNDSCDECEHLFQEKHINREDLLDAQEGVQWSRVRCGGDKICPSCKHFSMTFNLGFSISSLSSLQIVSNVAAEHLIKSTKFLLSAHMPDVDLG